MSKTCYIKCQSNKQAQDLRPYLVEVGFSEYWWVYIERGDYDCISLYSDDNSTGLYSERLCLMFDELKIHTVPLDADLSEQAKVIKELFEKQ